MTSRGRIEGALVLAKTAMRHQVEARVHATAGEVELEVLRSSRQRAAGDLRVVLSASQARELMRQLQGRADEADRLAYVLAKQLPVDELEVAVQAVARRLSEDEREGGASTHRAPGETG